MTGVFAGHLHEQTIQAQPTLYKAAEVRAANAPL